MTLASWITSLRFLLVPLLYWRLSRADLPGAFALLLLAGATDIVDGWVARARHEVSELGKTLDPLADKLVIFFTLLGMVCFYRFPAWIAGAYFVKELLQVLAGAFLLRKYHRLIPANRWGKSATVIFFVGFGAYFFMAAKTVGIVIVGLGFLLSVYALYTYYRDWLKLKDS